MHALRPIPVAVHAADHTVLALIQRRRIRLRSFHDTLTLPAVTAANTVQLRVFANAFSLRGLAKARSVAVFELGFSLIKFGRSTNAVAPFERRDAVQ
eukprot:1857308-Rhodomonas_salina.1